MAQIVGLDQTSPIVLHPSKTAMVMSGQSVNLTTLFLGRLKTHKRLTSTSYTYFYQ